MVLYGMFAGGQARCSGKTKAGERCRREGYVTNLQNAYWCHLHDPHPRPPRVARSGPPLAWPVGQGPIAHREG